MRGRPERPQTTRGLTLRGLRGPGVDLFPEAGDLDAPWPLLQLDNLTGVSLDGVWIAANAGTRCLSVQATGVSTVDVEFRDCGFVGASPQLTDVRLSEVPTGALPLGHSVRFSGCTWQTRDVDGSLGTLALVVKATRGEVAVRDGQFVGAAARMVLVRAGSVRFDQCRFANTQTSTARGNATVPQSGGVDVELAPSADGPIALSMHACASTSFQVLASAPVGGDLTRRTVVLSSLVHRPVSATLTSLFEAPSIVWAHADRSSDSLTVLGGVMTDATYTTPSFTSRFAGRALVAGVVYDAWLGPNGVRYVGATGTGAAVTTLGS